ncbi:uncharacterized protein LOC133191061 [Saccostrea echinata]|uniref:uncharacterized protein LOC133191061 n=1 Tax=Saccostrea echinata TaxID=191078 RepID=UPI002A7EB54E|nr:uncharacterized protein LOC133191061 [Saccostrea echinata]
MKMAESSKLENDCDIGLSSDVDWESSMFQNEDWDFLTSCHLEGGRRGRLGKVTEGDRDHPIALQDAPQLNKEEISKDDPSVHDIPESEQEPATEIDGPSQNMLPSQESGYYSQSECESDSLVENSEKQCLTYAGDHCDIASHQIWPARSIELPAMRKEREDHHVNKKTEKDTLKIINGKRKAKKKAKRYKKKKKCKKIVGRGVLKLLKPVINKYCKKKHCSSSNHACQLKILKKELVKYLVRKGLRQIEIKKKLMHSLLKPLIFSRKCWSVFPLLAKCEENSSNNMVKEWNRLASFSCLKFKNVSSLRLAKHGFFFVKDKGRIECFSCHKNYTQRDLENTVDYNSKLETTFHEEWCLIVGNVPIHPSSLEIPKALPSRHKRIFKDGDGRLITCKGFCGPNTFSVDQGNMLREFPALVKAYESYNPGNDQTNPFLDILDMLRKGGKNSAWGMRAILLKTGVITQDETTIELWNFNIIKFVCLLMKKKITVIGKCDCKERQLREEEQIYICPCSSKHDIKGIHFFQQWINSSLESRYLPICLSCHKQISWSFIPPPPCLFINLWHMDIRMECVPPEIHILNQIYRLGAIYINANKHYTVWVRRPEGMTFYDDSNVDSQDKYSGRFDYSKEFPGRGKPCLASYYSVHC